VHAVGGGLVGGLVVTGGLLEAGAELAQLFLHVGQERRPAVGALGQRRTGRPAVERAGR